MTKQIQAIRGMNDISPAQTPYWQFLETTLQKIASRYGYREIRFPIAEPTGLFERTIGQATDIVEKEMYTFLDRNGDSITLRPEGTAGCVRAAIQEGLLHNQIQRFWYQGPMFRHERPQKGRYRQFHQFGVEAFGMAGPDIDAEQIFMAARAWEDLGIKHLVKLQLNSLGSSEARNAYREKLVAYFTQHQDQLDEDSRRRLTTNPLRILDSKNPQLQSLIAQAPKLTDFLDAVSQVHFDKLRELLDAAHIAYEINPRLVRGLDYYGLTVYEWVTDQLGAQGTICAGGRYDVLVEQLGGSATPAVGFAIGLERVVALLEMVKKFNEIPDAYFVAVGDKANAKALTIAEHLRAKIPNLKLISDCGGGGFKNQFKRADKSGAEWALIMGETEAIDGTVTVKNLRDDRPQSAMGLDELVNFLSNRNFKSF